MDINLDKGINNMFESNMYFTISYLLSNFISVLLFYYSTDFKIRKGFFNFIFRLKMYISCINLSILNFIHLFLVYEFLLCPFLNNSY